jgi:fatty acid desaturase
VWFLVWRAGSGAHWGWDIPVLLAAIVWIGALQHQLAALGHEGSHFVLFRNRWLNELIADLFCFFPMFSSTQVYRLQHLAHHKWVNDPERDPDLSQLIRSGHKFQFPKTKGEVLVLLGQQLMPMYQVRYAVGRLKHLSHQETSARVAAAQPQSLLVPILMIVSLAAMIALLVIFVRHGDAMLLALVPGAFAVAALAVFGLLPAHLYGPSLARSPLPMPLFAVFRMGVFFLMFMIVAWTAWQFGGRIAAYLSVLWVVPLATTFALFNMIRQTLHHANADRGWLSNSRNFFVGPVFRAAVFPFGQDMHLVHHLFSSVPHYRLRALHDRMMQYPEYRSGTVQVDGLYFPRSGENRNPTVAEVLGPEYVPGDESEPFIDYAVDRAGLD